MYWLNILSSWLHEGVGVAISLEFKKDSTAISRRRCLSRYRLASRVLRDKILVSAMRASGKGYIRSSGSSNKLSDVSFFPPGLPKAEKRERWWVVRNRIR